MLLILKNSTTHTTRAALFTVLGITTGIVIHTTVVLTGLGTAIERWPRAFRLFWIVGGCYLGWLGLKLILSLRKKAKVGEDGRPPDGASPSFSDRGAFFQGFVTNITNPKVFIFFAGILAAWLTPESPPSKKLVLGAVIVGEALVLWSLFVLLLKWRPVAKCYARLGPWLEVAFGILLLWVAFGVIWRALPSFH